MAHNRYPHHVYLPYQLSRRHWDATALSRTQHLASLLSGRAVGELPELVQALDDATYPLHRWGTLLEIVTADVLVHL